MTLKTGCLCIFSSTTHYINPSDEGKQGIISKSRILSHSCSVFGSLDAFGYEEAWQHEEMKVKVDVFSTEVLKAPMVNLLDDVVFLQGMGIWGTPRCNVGGGNSISMYCQVGWEAGERPGMFFFW